MIGYEISHSTSGTWDKDIWFQDIRLKPASQEDSDKLTPSTVHNEISFPLNKIWTEKTVKRIYGPPGTGKTTRLVNIAIKAIRDGMRPEDIGYFAFTNVAADEARDRISKVLNIESSRFSNFSTLHSLTTRIGGNEGKNLCQRDHFQQFDSNIGVREEWLRAGDPSSVVVRPDHPVLTEYSIMFNRKDDRPSFSSKSIENAQDKLQSYYGLIIKSSDVLNYADKYFKEYESFKKINNLADFNDVVITVAKENFSNEKIPTFELLIIDEAQDLSALQWDVVIKLSSSAKSTIIAGDDDQAIMESFGAAPRIFNEFPTTEPDDVLPVSFRLPKNIKTFIDKKFTVFFDRNTSRKKKEWIENRDESNVGEVINSYH